MKQIKLTITALSPLAIGHKKPGSVSEASDYIPGSVLRGAIAAVMLQQSGRQNEDLSRAGGDFQSLFLNDRAAIFHNAYPGPADGSAEVNVLPTTAVSSKTKSGFKPKKNGVFDTLIDRFCAEVYGHPYDPNCPVDAGRVEPFSGFYSKSEGKYESHSVAKRLLTRVGINRSRATAQDEMLYSLEVLSEFQGKKEGQGEKKEKEPATYYSSILVENDTLAESLCEFINAHTFRLGGATSRGLGKVKICATAGTPQSNVISRLQKFNDTLQSRWQNSWNVFIKPQKQLEEKRTYFTLNLQSDAILTEDWRRTTVISETMLGQFTGIDDPDLKLHVAYSSYDYRSGWNSAWGLMKDVELITNKGGVYLFSTTQPHLWEKALAELEVWGVGERTSEGFGQIQVCNEFHLVFRENAV